MGYLYDFVRIITLIKRLENPENQINQELVHRCPKCIKTYDKWTKSNVEVKLNTVVDDSLIWDEVVDSKSCWQSNQVLKSPEGSFEDECNIVLMVDFGFQSDVLFWELSLDDTFDFSQW